MPTDNGFSNQKKIGQAQFETVHSLGSERFGKAVAPKGLAEVTPEAAIVSVTLIEGPNGQIQYYNIEFTAHGAMVGNILRLTDGTLIATEYDILQIIDADNFYILPITAPPQVGDLATIMRWVSTKLGLDGGISVSPSPIQFVQDGVGTFVNEDTVDPSQNLGLPIRIFANDGTPAAFNGAQLETNLPNVTGVDLAGSPPSFLQVGGTDGVDGHTLLTDTQGILYVSDVTVLTPSFFQILNLTTVAQSIVVPPTTKWFKVMAEDSNSANIRMKITGTATISSGMQFQPGRSEDFPIGTGGDISFIAESGANQKLSVIIGY
jgi:hypothetical protein